MECESSEDSGGGGEHPGKISKGEGEAHAEHGDAQGRGHIGGVEPGEGGGLGETEEGGAEDKDGEGVGGGVGDGGEGG